MLPKLRLDIVANDSLILGCSYKCSGRVIQSGIIHTTNEIHTGISFAVSQIPARYRLDIIDGFADDLLQNESALLPSLRALFNRLHDHTMLYTF